MLDFRNSSINGALRSLRKDSFNCKLAWRAYGLSAWAGKPAGVLGASVGAIGTAMAQQHLRNVLAYLDVSMLGQPDAFIHAKDGFFDEAGNIDADSKKFLQTWMDQYVTWVKKYVG